MRAALIDALANALMSNIGNRLTHELANGIATAVNQVGLAIEAELAASAPPARRKRKAGGEQAAPAADPPASAEGA